MSTAAIKEYMGLRVERRSVIEKGDTNIMLMDQTRIVVPYMMRQKLFKREHLAHSGQQHQGQVLLARDRGGRQADGGGMQAVPAQPKVPEEKAEQAGTGAREPVDAGNRHRLL